MARSLVVVLALFVVRFASLLSGNLQENARSKQKGGSHQRHRKPAQRVANTSTMRRRYREIEAVEPVFYFRDAGKRAVISTIESAYQVHVERCLQQGQWFMEDDIDQLDLYSERWVHLIRDTDADLNLDMEEPQWQATVLVDENHPLFRKLWTIEEFVRRVDILLVQISARHNLFREIIAKDHSLYLCLKEICFEVGRQCLNEGISGRDMVSSFEWCRAATWFDREYNF